MVEITPIRSEADYDAALAKIDSLMEAKLGTAEGDLLDILVTRVETYERKLYPISPPDAISAIEYRMESRESSEQVADWK